MPNDTDPEAPDDYDTLERKARLYAAGAQALGRPLASAPLSRAPISKPLGRLSPPKDPLRKADEDTEA